MIVEEVVKSMGTSEEVDGDGESEEEESLLLVVSDWAAGSEYCRLMNV